MTDMFYKSRNTKILSVVRVPSRAEHRNYAISNMQEYLAEKIMQVLIEEPGQAFIVQYSGVMDTEGPKVNNFPTVKGLRMDVYITPTESDHSHE